MNQQEWSLTARMPKVRWKIESFSSIPQPQGGPHKNALLHTHPIDGPVDNTILMPTSCRLEEFEHLALDTRGQLDSQFVF